MFSLDDEDTSQSDIDSVGISGSDMFRHQYSVNCESEQKMSSNKSEVYRRLECNMNIFRLDSAVPSAISESTSRFDNLILNGSVSVPTNSFVCSNQCIEEVSTVKIVNIPPVKESPNEFETISLTASARPTIATKENDNQTSARLLNLDTGGDSFISPYVVPLQYVDGRKRRFVMAVTIASVIGVTVIIVVIVLLTFSLHR